MKRKDRYWRSKSAPTIGDVDRRFVKKGPPSLTVPRGLKGTKLGKASEGKSYRQMWKEADTELGFEEWLVEALR